MTQDKIDAINRLKETLYNFDITKNLIFVLHRYENYWATTKIKGQ